MTFSQERVAINSLSVVAEDFADSLPAARALYNVIREYLLETKPANLLPVVYVIDSILKNARGKFIELIQKDAQHWMPLVHTQLTTLQQAKLERVYKTWQDTNLFTQEALRIIGRCFSLNRTSSHKVATSRNNPLATTTIVAGIPRTGDGSLVIAAPLRQAMQAVLDEIQHGTQDELEKVSLERLAELDPELLANIKNTAHENMATMNMTNGTGGRGSDSDTKPAFLQHDSRSPGALKLERDWAELAWDSTKANTVIDKLRYKLDADVLYTQQEAVQMTVYLGAAQALSTVLQTTLDRVQQAQVNRTAHHGAAVAWPQMHQAQYRGQSLFTNAGVKQRNEIAIGYLYQIGLPFVSSSDGRRFASQLELSQHLDALFKRNQLEKTMARTEERGWSGTDSEWMKLEYDAHVQMGTAAASAGTDSPSYNTEQAGDVCPADEARDRCIVCGINFKMFFDNDNGIYMYKNCCEKPVENDEAAEEETSLELVHMTCWKGLGSPMLLTTDQVDQDIRLSRD